MNLRTRWKLVLIILILALVVSAFSITAIALANKKEENPEVQQTNAASVALNENSFNWGAYNSTNEFTISNWEELLFFANIVDTTDNWGIDAGKYYTFSGKTVTLLADIRGTGIKPIGHNNADGNGNFCGTFNGNYHTIRDLFLTSEEDIDNIGLFKKLDGGTVKNLRLTNVKISTPTDENTYSSINAPAIYESHYNLGAIAGYSTGTIENCSVEGVTFTLNHISHTGFTGTMIGGTAPGGSIRNCFVKNMKVNITRTYYYEGIGNEIWGTIYGAGTVVAGNFAITIPGKTLTETYKGVSNWEDFTQGELRYDWYCSSQATYDCVSSKPTSFTNINCDSDLDSSSTWYYGGTQWNDGVPYLEQFISPTTLTFKGPDGTTFIDSTTGASGSPSLQIKVPSAPIDSSSYWPTNPGTSNPLNVLVYKVEADGGDSLVFVRWTWNSSTKTYTAEFEKSQIKFKFESLGLVTKKWSNNAWVLDNSVVTKEYNSPQGVDSEGFVYIDGDIYSDVTISAILTSNNDGTFSKLTYTITNGTSSATVYYKFAPEDYIFGVYKFSILSKDRINEDDKQEYSFTQQYLQFSDLYDTATGYITISPRVYTRPLLVYMEIPSNAYFFYGGSTVGGSSLTYMVAPGTIATLSNAGTSEEYDWRIANFNLKKDGVSIGTTPQIWLSDQGLITNFSYRINGGAPTLTKAYENLELSITKDQTIFSIVVENPKSVEFKKVSGAKLTILKYDANGSCTEEEITEDSYITTANIRPYSELIVETSSDITVEGSDTPVSLGGKGYSSILFKFDPIYRWTNDGGANWYEVHILYEASVDHYFTDDGTGGNYVVSGKDSQTRIIEPTVKWLQTVSIKFTDGVLDIDSDKILSEPSTIFWTCHVDFSTITMTYDSTTGMVTYEVKDVLRPNLEMKVTYNAVDSKYILAGHSINDELMTDGIFNVTEYTEVHPVYTLKTYGGNFEGEIIK